MWLSGRVEANNFEATQVVLGFPVHSTALPALNSLADQMGCNSDCLKVSSNFDQLQAVEVICTEHCSSIM